MVAQSKDIYPIIPVSNWWDLRDRFKDALPRGSVTVGYLAGVLKISDATARNLIPSLKRMRLLNEDNTHSERAVQWRDDAQYANVCEDIKNESYPQELLDAFPQPAEGDREAIDGWFARRTKAGARAVRKMTTFYLLMCQADVSKAMEPGKEKPKVAKAPTKPKVEKPSIAKPEAPSEEEIKVPSININVQIHIPSEASASQIDQIFESMSRHLNIRRSK